MLHRSNGTFDSTFDGSFTLRDRSLALDPACLDQRDCSQKVNNFSMHALSGGAAGRVEDSDLVHRTKAVHVHQTVFSYARLA